MKFDSNDNSQMLLELVLISEFVSIMLLIYILLLIGNYNG